MKRLILVLLAALVLIPTTVLGNTPDVRPHTFDDGESFVCFSLDDSKLLLKLRLSFEEQKKQLDKYKEWIDVKKQQIEKLDVANSLLEAKVEAFQTENANLRMEMQTQDSWWKSPYLWFTVGIIAGSGMGIAIFYAAKEG